MDFYDRVANFITNLQDMPERRRHSIFSIVMVFTVLAMGTIGMMNTSSNVNKIKQDSQQAYLLGSREEIDNQLLQDGQEQAEENNDTLSDEPKEGNLLPGWRQYQNVDYFYEIQYPIGWLVDSSKTEKIYISSDLMDEEQNDESYIQITVSAIEDGENSIAQQINKRVKTLQSDLFSLKKINIDNQEGFLIRFVCGEENCGPTEHFIIKNNHLYLIYSNLQSESFLNEIISTFKFI